MANGNWRRARLRALKMLEAMANALLLPQNEAGRHNILLSLLRRALSRCYLGMREAGKAFVANKIPKEASMLLDNFRGFLFRDIIDANVTALFKKNIDLFQILMSYYRRAMMQVETKFKVLNEQFSLQYDRNPIESIKARLKSPESIARKIQARRLPASISGILQNINGIAGARVICSFLEDICLLADCLLQQDDARLIERKDCIKSPKPGGYRSLHLIVEAPIFLEQGKRETRVEAQLRTIAMDFWASVDHKIRCKKDIPESEQAEISKELHERAEICARMDKRMEALRNRVFK